MQRLLPLCVLACVLGACAGPVMSFGMQRVVTPRGAGVVTVAVGAMLGALATAMWIDNDPGDRSNCGSDGMSQCWPSRVGALVFAIPATLDLFTGTRSLVTNTYPWRSDK